MRNFFSLLESIRDNLGRPDPGDYVQAQAALDIADEDRPELVRYLTEDLLTSLNKLYYIVKQFINNHTPGVVYTYFTSLERLIKETIIYIKQASKGKNLDEIYGEIRRNLINLGRVRLEDYYFGYWDNIPQIEYLNRLGFKRKDLEMFVTAHDEVLKQAEDISKYMKMFRPRVNVNNADLLRRAMQILFNRSRDLMHHVDLESPQFTSLPEEEKSRRVNHALWAKLGVHKDSPKALEFADRYRKYVDPVAMSLLDKIRTQSGSP